MRKAPARRGLFVLVVSACRAAESRRAGANRSARSAVLGSASARSRLVSPPQDVMTMVADAIRLMLFPALMAFAASSDLLTMTISNRVSLILAGGFRRCWRWSAGMSVTDILVASRRGRASFSSSRSASSRAAGSAAATPSSRRRRRLWLGFDHLLPYLIYASLFGGALTLLLHPIPPRAAAGGAGAAGVGAAAARQRRRRALRHRARRRRARGLSANAVDGSRRDSDAPRQRI